VRFKVYPMRNRGRAVEWRDIKNGPSFVGDLRFHSIQIGEKVHRVATLFSGNKPDAKNILPDLFDPTVLEISTQTLQVRGYERVNGREGVHAVLQEWLCEESD
jgi:hypothetical protein